MSIFVFIAILVVLILAHEFGHFIVAKRAGVRVDEFGIGFPPRLYGRKVGETEYTVNAIPFGGFVKIFGEDPASVPADAALAARSLTAKPRLVQAAVIAAGVAFNIILAWLLLSLGFGIGMPTSAESIPAGARFKNPELTITGVLPDSPAAQAGLKPGDRIHSLSAGEERVENPSAEEVQRFVASHTENLVTVSFRRGDEVGDIAITPAQGVVADRPAVGIALDFIGTATLPPHRALWEGAQATADLTALTAGGIAQFFKTLFMGAASFNEVLGPVGIVKTGIVGSAIEFGFVHVLMLTAIISINLAIINLIPFPALDGGRLLFLMIEGIKRSPINPKIATAVNGAGFVLLLVLMVLITYHDIIRPAI